MERIFEQIKNTLDLEPKKDLRKNIRNRILVIKFRFPLFAIFSLLIANLVFLSVHSYLKMFENETISVITAFVRDFELSYSYLISFMSGLQEVLSLKLFTIWLINLSLVAYLSGVVRHYRRELFNIV